jgi:zinc transporter 7
MSGITLLLSITSINLIPIIIIFLSIPSKSFRRYQCSLRILLSFASGGLMGDVFLRLLPYIILSYNDSIDIDHHHHQHQSRAGLFILAGIFLSFIIEKFFRYFQSMFYIKQSSDTSFLFFC